MDATWIFDVAQRLGVAPAALGSAIAGNPQQLVQLLAQKGIEPPDVEAPPPSTGERLLEAATESGQDFATGETPTTVSQLLGALGLSAQPEGPIATGDPIDLRPAVASGAASGALSALSGVKAPALPEMQRLSSPGVPTPREIPQGNLQAMLEQLGLLNPAQQLRLAQTLR